VDSTFRAQHSTLPELSLAAQTSSASGLSLETSKHGMT
jgi:hypothetical protein